MLNVFLDSGLSFDTKADDQSTALHCAARAGKAAAVEYLLKRGASVDVRNDKERLPIHEAILSKRCDAVEPFFDRVAQKQLLDMAQELESYMIQSGTIAIVDAYIKRLGDDFADQKAPQKLRFAVRTGHSLLVTTLLDDPGVNGNPLHRGRHAPIHLAALLGRVSVMEILIACDRIDKTSKTNRSRQALHLAASKGHTTIVQQLIRHQSVDVNCRDNHKATPLHYASSNGHTMVLAQLIRHPGVDVNCRDKDEATPLHHAVSNGHWETASLLLRHSDLISDGHRISSDVSPISLTFTKQDLLHRLFKHPDFGDPNKRIPGRQGTILHVAVEKDDCEMIEALLACPNIHLRVYDQVSNTPLVAAAKDGKLEAVKLLLQHQDSNVDEYTKRSKQQALNFARFRNHDEVVDFLLSQGAIDNHAKAPTTAPTTALTNTHIDDSQNTTLQPNHEAHFGAFDDDMDDATIEAWEEFSDAEEWMEE